MRGSIKNGIVYTSKVQKQMGSIRRKDYLCPGQRVIIAKISLTPNQKYKSETNERQSGGYDMNEAQWDKLLRIKTTGRDESNSDQYHYPYDPTPYSVLERLANSGYITKKNTVIDYGCGKGRVDYFLSYQTRCKSIGVEYDDRIQGKCFFSFITRQMNMWLT